MCRKPNFHSDNICFNEFSVVYATLIHIVAFNPVLKVHRDLDILDQVHYFQSILLKKKIDEIALRAPLTCWKCSSAEVVKLNEGPR